MDLLDIVLDNSTDYKKQLLDIENGHMGHFIHSKSKYLMKKNTKITEDDLINAGERTGNY